jgi:hypothetical protein
MSDPSEREAYRRLGFETNDAREKTLNVWVPSGVPNSSKDRLTLLLPSRGYRAAKLYRKHEDGKVKVFEYDAGTWFRVVEIGVNSAWDLFRALSATSVGAGENFAVRAGLSASGRSRLAAGREILRRSSEKYPEAQRNLEDRASHLFVADADHWPLPTGIAKTDLKAQAEHVVAEVSKHEPSFADATFVVQASNSAGQSDSDFSLKLYGWMRDAVTTETLRDWTHAVNAMLVVTTFDIKQPRTVQPIYHHAPRFIGMSDPMQGRRWQYLHRGGREIVLTLTQEAVFVASAPPSGATRSAGGCAPIRWKERLRAELGVTACYGAIHGAVYRAIASGANDREIIEEIRAVARDGRVFDPGKWDAEYVRDKTDPSFIAEIIRDAQAREALRAVRIAALRVGICAALGLGGASDKR